MRTAEVDGDVVLLPGSRRAEVVDVLCEAFRAYPVMRFVLGTADDYDARLRTLVDFFVAARYLREEPVLGLGDRVASRLVGVALMTLPGERESPAALAVAREDTWATLGADARTRYEIYGEAASRWDTGAFHHHLNMIGVRPSHAGRGLARPLMSAAHALAATDTASEGVSLCTETRQNVSLYEHFGYRLVGSAQVTEELETWSMFRETPRAGA
jgi:GNAT superfamily N-acetyltransferase